MKNAQDRFSKKCFKNFLDRFFEKIDENLSFFEKSKMLTPGKSRVDGASMDSRWNVNKMRGQERKSTPRNRHGGYISA